VGVTSQQRMLTPPLHLILPLQSSEVRVAEHSICNCLLDCDCFLHIVNFAILYSYLNNLHNIDSNGRLKTQLYDKRDDFNFAIVNFSFLFSNTSLPPAHGLYALQIYRYPRGFFAYEDF
jgi:hypothetical protein